MGRVVVTLSDLADALPTPASRTRLLLIRGWMLIPLPRRIYTVSVDGNRKRVARATTKNDDKEPAPPEEIFEALREIPRLERADLLRAYSTFIRDDRLFRSLMALPEDMRKYCLLMEVGNQ
ncbi:unnamed protein product [Miscanthus lutarioriparius]|uniref:Uncharacterized protein n=1 Tax=Miscanthus lutarioriparius TaxID=422564 RepID=A0A811RH21_9POAL|nr:unnamed protein product [Miscanthus lutarioriparius]